MCNTELPNANLGGYLHIEPKISDGGSADDSRGETDSLPVASVVPEHISDDEGDDFALSGGFVCVMLDFDITKSGKIRYCPDYIVREPQWSQSDCPSGNYTEPNVRFTLKLKKVQSSFGQVLAVNWSAGRIITIRWTHVGWASPTQPRFRGSSVSVAVFLLDPENSLPERYDAMVM
ncbi:hypothetical protein B0H17DRAFT_1145925 [Mycena rosella]|uniref:Uncharacterized protein n=1 Tax=Mycena rosella TaxID=1033263 RepID=A0AAD7CSC6_MYCRO|nr:hypothetical protein B0H17DRAFT_1145925 [Mycena rosella]